MKKNLLQYLAMALLSVIPIRSADSAEQKSPQKPLPTETEIAMLELRDLFYYGSSKPQLIQLLSEDLTLNAAHPANKSEVQQWLAMRDTPMPDGSKMQDDVYFWLLISKLALEESATVQAHEAAQQILSLTEDPSFIYLAWQTLRQLGHNPSDSEKNRVLGVSLEKWVPGEPKGWAMTLTYSNALPRLYISWGAGAMGNITEPIVREKAEALLSEAGKIVSRMTKATDTNLPKENEIAIYILTPSGVRVAMANEAQVIDGKGPYAAVGLAEAKLTASLLQWPKEQ
jgi:hypothetical protein